MDRSGGSLIGRNRRVAEPAIYLDVAAIAGPHRDRRDFDHSSVWQQPSANPIGRAHRIQLESWNCLLWLERGLRITPCVDRVTWFVMDRCCPFALWARNTAAATPDGRGDCWLESPRFHRVN